MFLTRSDVHLLSQRSRELKLGNNRHKLTRFAPAPSSIDRICIKRPLFTDYANLVCVLAQSVTSFLYLYIIHVPQFKREFHGSVHAKSITCVISKVTFSLSLVQQ